MAPVEKKERKGGLNMMDATTSYKKQQVRRFIIISKSTIADLATTAWAVLGNKENRLDQKPYPGEEDPSVKAAELLSR